MKTLFVNATMGNPNSHTLTLCREFLKGCNQVEEVDLLALGLAPFDYAQAQERSEKAASEQWDDPVFALARQLAQADQVLVGAPYWDLSFPAALKIYVEHACVCGLTFHYTETGECEGLCKSSRLVYVSSCGGMIEGANYGFEYLQGISRMFGLGPCVQVAAQGMDIVGADTAAIMEAAIKEIRSL